MPRGTRQRRCAQCKPCSDVRRCLGDSWVLLSLEPRLQVTHTAPVPAGESRSGARAARAGSTHRPGSDGRCSRGDTDRLPWQGRSWRCSHTRDRSPGSPGPSGRQGRLERGQRERTHGIGIIVGGREKGLCSSPCFTQNTDFSLAIPGCQQGQHC